MTISFLVLLAAYAALQISLVFAIRPAYARGTRWPVATVGVLAFLLSVCGYLQIPFELIKRRGRVLGIDFVFLAIDCAGAVFSLLALAFQDHFDTLFVVL